MSESSPTPDRSTRVQTVWAVAGLVVLGAVAYHNSFDGILHFDDSPNISHNEALDSLTAAFLGTPDEVPRGLHRRTIPHFTLALDKAVHGLSLTGLHLTNLVVHLLAGLLLFDVVRLALDRDRVPDGLRSGRVAIAFASAALWLVHPLQTESVTYVIQRCESMMGMFFFLVFDAFLRAERAETTKGRRLWLAVTVLACWLGMFSKEVMITCPLALVLFDRLFFATSWRELFRKRAVTYAGLACSAAFLVFCVYWARTPTENVQRLALQVLTPPSRWGYFWTQPEIVLHYLKLVFWPYPQCFLYHWPVQENLTWIVLPTLFHAGMLLVGVLCLRRAPAVTFLVTSFYLVLAPTSSLKPIPNLAFEHRMYVPLAAVLVLTVLAAWTALSRLSVSPRGRRIALVAGAVVAAVPLTGLTIARNELYADHMAFWQDVVDHGYPGYTSHMALGVGHVREGEFDEAIAEYQRALEIEPRALLAIRNLSSLLIELGRLEEAEQYELEALELQPLDATVQFNHGLGLQGRARLAAARGEDAAAAEMRKKALEHFQLSLELTRTSITHHNAAVVSQELGWHDHAMKHYAAALELSPRAINSRLGLANLLLAHQKDELGRKHLSLALQQNPEVRPQVEQIIRLHERSPGGNAGEAQN